MNLIILFFLIGALSLITLGSIGTTYDELAKVLGFFNGNNRRKLL